MNNKNFETKANISIDYLVRILNTVCRSHGCSHISSVRDDAVGVWYGSGMEKLGLGRNRFYLSRIR